ncbi:MAG TPA: hypothetical protein VGS58_10245, partial [Candidatus Sulfopaludibacter sp.]|nr:hypothetical protein [Candidatus Sulfopaludibacter sp.]
MLYRRFSTSAFTGLLAATLLISVSLAQTPKRPLTHKDYDAWRTISSQRLSNDGKFLAYGVFPQEGDGEVIVRNLVTGQETRHAAGARPQPPTTTTEEEGPPPQPRGVTIAFSADSRTLVFSTFPPKADVDKAKKEKKTAEQMPKDGMVVLNLAAGAVTKIDRVKQFHLPEDASGYLAYLKEAPESAPPARGAATGGPGDFADQQGGRGGRGGGNGARGPRPEFGSDLVLRTLADGAERTFPDVVEFTLTEDGKQLVYAVSAKDTAKNGVFVAQTGSSDAAAPLLAGKGKYLKLTWDEKQTQLAFLSSHDDPDAKTPKWKLYGWDRKAPTADVLASAETPGFRKEFVISDKGNLSISKDGTRVFFGCAPPVPEKKDEAEASTDEKAVVDLWSYKDDYIQPIQKIRANRDRDRTYTAVYSIPDRKLVQLADSQVENATPSENNQWVLGSDDREYRRLADFEERYSDEYVIDASTGARKLVAKKSHTAGTWSPNGRYLLLFDGKDWNTISVPDGKSTNLTASLPVKFWNEETDTPSTPNAYGSAGWTKDGSAVLIYDHYDVWRISPDGSGAKNLTAGYGRAHNLQFRYVRTETDPRERWIDPAKPLLLSATNLKTEESGFFRASLDGGQSRQLVMAAKSFGAPVKAKDADVYLLTGQSFNEFPDLITTDGSFKELRKVSNANPQ